MSESIYIKPPRMVRTMMIGQVILSILFIPFGIMFVFVAEGEARMFAALFALIWVVGCGALVYHAVSVLKLIKNGEFEIAAIKSGLKAGNADLSGRLRSLEKARQDKLISEEEYRIKRSEIMESKW